MLTDAQHNLIWQIDTACRKCIRAVLYFNAVTGKTPELWTFSQNCFGEIAAIQWCHVFNKYKDCTHFSQLFGDPTIAAIDSKFTLDNVRTRLRATIGLTHDQYTAFRQQLVDFRNLYAAHWDYEKKGVDFPDLDMAMTLCVEMRDILRQVVVKAVSDKSRQKLQDLRCLLTSYDNEQQLRFFRLEAEHLKKIQ